MKKKEDNRWITIGIIIIILLALIAFTTRDKEEEIDYDKMTNEEIEQIIDNRVSNLKELELSEKNETERMQYYVGEFIGAIEEKKYERAYEMLYEEFRKTFFPTLESFETHVKTKFPSFMTLNHTNCERNGNVYILWTTITDIQAIDSSNAIDMNFVVKEDGLNDFVLSFSVK